MRAPAVSCESPDRLSRHGNGGAVDAFRQALIAKPDHEESLTNLVAVWLRTGRTAEAREVLASFLTVHPEAVFGYSLAARIAAQSGGRAEAVQFATRGLEKARAQRDERQEQALRGLLERLRAP